MRWFRFFRLRRGRLSHSAEHRVRDLNGGRSQTWATPHCLWSSRLAGFLGSRGSSFFIARSSRSLPLGATVPFALHLLGFGNAAESFRIDVGKTLAHVRGLLSLDASGDTVDATIRINCYEVAPVAACQRPAFHLKRRLKLLAVFGGLPNHGQHLLGFVGADAGSFGLQHFGMAGGSLGPVLAIAFDMR